MGGRVQAMIAALQTMAPFVTSNRLKMIAVLSDERQMGRMVAPGERYDRRASLQNDRQTGGLKREREVYEKRPLGEPARLPYNLRRLIERSPGKTHTPQTAGIRDSGRKLRPGDTAGRRLDNGNLDPE